MSAWRIAVLVLLFPGLMAAPAGAAPAGQELAQVRATVDEASQDSSTWQGPVAGPRAQPTKSIAVVCEDLRNGGVLAVVRGIEEAANVIGWQVRIHDARGSSTGRRTALANALAQAPSGVALVGTDADDLADSLRSERGRGMPIVGWHIGALPGPMEKSGVAMNVTTDPLSVARIAAMAAVADSNGQAGVVIFTDSNFKIALTKSEVMARVIRSCGACKLLEIRDLAISRAGDLMPDVTADLLKKYGARWTYALAINDIYFDYAVPELIRIRRPNGSLKLLSAGDGSAAAFLRIQAHTFQTATVAEPLNQQGWQIVDELNRLFAGQAVSGYVAPAHLVTADNLPVDGKLRLQYDPANGYRDIYRGIWGR